MPTITFDGTAKTIAIGYDGPITSVTATGIYSAWKLWVKAGNAQYLPAFAESVGGNDLGGGVALAGYYFIRNDLGWTLDHAAQSYQIQLSGDFYPTDPAQPFVELVVDPNLSVTWIFQRSAASYLNTVDVSNMPLADKTVFDIADAVWDEPRAEFMYALARNKVVTDPTSGTYTVYAADGVTPLFVADLYQDAAGTTPYAGAGSERREQFT